MKRVAITGMGVVSGLGHSLNEVWTNAIEGKPGVSKIENSDVTKLPVQFGGEVKNFELSEDILDAKSARIYDKFTKFALHSAHEAITKAGLVGAYEPERVGSILGCGMGGFPAIEACSKVFNEKGARRVSPFFIPAIIPNMPTGLITMNWGFKGVNYSLSSACASASHAISQAAFEIMMGRHDAIITGGTESVLCNLPMSGFISMKALCKWDGNPPEASRPFDSDRAGFVMGEGAGILVLEDLEKAKARGATIYAEIVGHGATSDAHHMTAPHPDGAGAIRCMNQAIEMAGISKEQVGYINAHGTATPLGDIAETKSIKSVLGDHAKNIFVSSTKSMTGHLLGAAGGIETIFCAQALKEGILPPTINLKNQDPQCDLDYIANKSKKFQAEYALNNSFGFGGTNSSLVLKHYKG